MSLCFTLFFFLGRGRSGYEIMFLLLPTAQYLSCYVKKIDVVVVVVVVVFFKPFTACQLRGTKTTC